MNREGGAIMHTRRGLVVTDDPERAEIRIGWLHNAGYTTYRCVGPGHSLECPRLHGARCILREVTDIAIVDLECDDDADVCTKVPEDGSTVLVRRSGPQSLGAMD